MRRATTPVHTFEFPFSPQELTKILLTYSQDTEDGEVILNKTKEDFTFDGNIGSVTLTQEETNLFEAMCGCHTSCNNTPYVLIQIRAKTTNGQALATDVWRVPLKNVLNDEVL